LVNSNPQEGFVTWNSSEVISGIEVDSFFSVIFEFFHLSDVRTALGPLGELVAIEENIHWFASFKDVIEKRKDTGENVLSKRNIRRITSFQSWKQGRVPEFCERKM
jgi:hypothetical protein